MPLLELVQPDPVEQPVQMAQAQIPLPSGRPFVVALPIDFTDVEALQAVSALLMVMDQIRAQRPSSRIVIPNGVRPA